MSRNVDDAFTKRPRRKIRFLRIALIGFLLLVAGIGIGVPMVLQNRGLMVSLINRYAGLEPMHVDLERIEIGWFKPFKLQGLKLIDDQGAELVNVTEIETELGLFALMLDYQNLRTITVRGANANVEVQPGTTNIEEALKPFLNAPGTDPEKTPDSASGSSFALNLQGRIRVSDAIFHFKDSVDLSTWDFTIKQADVPIPTAEVPIPPMTLIGTIQQTSSLPGEVLLGGQFNIKTEPLAAQPTNADLEKLGLVPLKMTIATNALPLHWYSLVKRRMPEIPLDTVAGTATVSTEIELHNQQQILARVQTTQIDSLRIHAPELLGQRGASIQQIKLAGLINKGAERVTTEGLTLVSDVGQINATLDLPLAPSVPTLSTPWLLNADYEVNGEIDLPRVIQVAPDLLQMQDQVELLAGKATLKAIQRRISPDPTQPPTSDFQVKLGGLQANMSGTTMRWDEALDAKLQIKPAVGNQPSFLAQCLAEFCEIRGEGDMQHGKLGGSFDLAKMQQRLSQWFALPVESLAGSAECQLDWQQDESNRLVTRGVLRTTPVRLATKYGQLNEPAWEGNFQVIARLDNGSIIQMDRSEVHLKANEELLSASILDPISLVPQTTDVVQLPPANMQMTLKGDLNGWVRRAKLFAGIDLGVDLGGVCDLEAKGVLDASHVEVMHAAFKAKNFYVQSGETRFAEPEVVGNFQGRVNSNNIAALQVDNLLIQSGSFALQGRDEATGDGATRLGQAGFRLNPNRLLASMQTENSPPSSVTVDGDVTGQLKWQVDPSQLTWMVVADAKDIRAIQQSQPAGAVLVSTAGPQAPNSSVLWHEPQARVSATGKYTIATGALDINESQVQTEWFAYGGTAALVSSAESLEFKAEGDVTYDAAKVTERLRPWTGSYLNVVGQRTQPLQVTWISNSNQASWADSLQASSKLGWDSANVIGIPIGNADVPILIQNGHFLSKAEIPVSQGKLRWNLDGNIASNPITIIQAPETVIDNVAITPQMCQGWLKYVAPLLADVTSVQGNLSLQIDDAKIVPTDLMQQTVQGQLTVHGANVGPGPLADQILLLVQQIRNLRKGVGATDGGGQATTWLHMPQQNIGFNVQNGRVAHQNMQIQAGDVIINTSGTVGIDGSLELVASVPVQADWVEKAPALQSLAGQQIQLPLRGTVQKPQVDFGALTQVAQQIGTAALRNEAQKQLEKGVNKLLGPLSNQLAPLQQGMQQGVQQVQQGVQQNIPQVLQNFQIPGFGSFGGTPAPTPTPVPGAAPALPPATPPALPPIP